MLTSLLLLFTALMNPFSLLPRYNFRKNNITLSLKCAVLILFVCNKWDSLLVFQADKVTIMYPMRFQDSIDIVLATSFLQVFWMLPFVSLITFLAKCSSWSFCLLCLSYQLHLTLKTNLTYHNATIRAAMYICSNPSIKEFSKPK
jgi:hypothetical protein